MASVLTRFDLAETLRCRNGLRRAMQGAPTLQSAAGAGCRFLYDELVTRTGSRACVLVRCYKLNDYGSLPRDVQAFAQRSMPEGMAPTPTMRCLALVGTCGDEADWNECSRSRGHRAIPLPTAAIVERAPMIAELFRAFGVGLESVVAERTSIVKDLEGKSYGVFHVKNASGSPYIPAQDFVEQHGVRSVLGFGGSLKNGDLFAIILFSRVTVPDASAERFRTLALDVKTAFFNYTQIFD